MSEALPPAAVEQSFRIGVKHRIRELNNSLEISAKVQG
jgi:hypothetical protein